MLLNKDLLLKVTEDYNINIDSCVFERLDKYAEKLVETNKMFNLTAITEPDDVTLKHFADSLSIFKYAEFPEGASVIDVGTGAGFPGLVMLLTRPDLKLTFLDGTKKKLSFIESVLSETGVEGKILHGRAEEMGKKAEYREKYDFATARAVANLTSLSEYCLPFVRVGGSFISMKSAAVDEEIAEAKKAISVLGGKIEADNVFNLVENTPRRIIIIRKKSQTPIIYPRASAKIAKSPIK